MANTPSSRRGTRSRKAPTGRRDAAAVRRTAPPTAERRRATPAEQLTTELLAVKDALDGALTQFGARVSGRLAEALEALQRPEPPPNGTVKKMIVKVRDLRLKPERGRVKDLLRLKALADELAELLAGE